MSILEIIKNFVSLVGGLLDYLLDFVDFLFSLPDFFVRICSLYSSSPCPINAIFYTCLIAFVVVVFGAIFRAFRATFTGGD